MGQRNVERHLGGELKEGYLSVEVCIRSFDFSFNRKKNKDTRNEKEIRINKLLAQVRKETLAGELGKKARRWSCCCTTFVEIGWSVGRCGYDKGREFMRLSECGTRAKKTPRRWEIAARGGCS
jgi:hypothetical protein